MQTRDLVHARQAIYLGLHLQAPKPCCLSPLSMHVCCSFWCADGIYVHAFSCVFTHVLEQGLSIKPGASLDSQPALGIDPQFPHFETGIMGMLPRSPPCLCGFLENSSPVLLLSWQASLTADPFLQLPER